MEQNKKIVDAMNYIKDNKRFPNDITEETIIGIIKNYNPYFILFVPNQTDKMKIEAIKSEPNIIQFIDDLSEELLITAIDIKPNVIQLIKNLSENLQMVAVKRSTDSIIYI